MMKVKFKIILVFCLLTIFFGVQLKCAESSVPFFPTKETVDITNHLDMRYLAVQCKDKNNDLGVHQLNVGQTFSFTFFPKVFFPSTLYFCHFVWLEGDHYFDIYVQDRDGYCQKNSCSWDIIANGPCRTISGHRECYNWNPPAEGKRLFMQQSNNTLHV